jgi:membrane protein YdbS with pleckstrin-like domain
MTDDLLSRIDFSEQFADAHEKEIQDLRVRSATKAGDLEKRVAGLERLVWLLVDALAIFLAVGAAGLAVSFVQGGEWYPGSWQTGFVAAVAFVLALYISRKIVAWHLGT